MTVVNDGLRGGEGPAGRGGSAVTRGDGWLVAARVVMRLQGVYYIVTGLWPVVHMHSFELISGPKTDDWLVRMVGLLAASIGMTLLAAARGRRPSGEGVLLSFTSALSFLAIDVTYALAGTIRDVYLLDAAVEIGFIVLVAACWMVGTLAARRRTQTQ